MIFTKMHGLGNDYVQEHFVTGITGSERMV